MPNVNGWNPAGIYIYRNIYMKHITRNIISAEKTPYISWYMLLEEVFHHRQDVWISTTLFRLCEVDFTFGHFTKWAQPVIIYMYIYIWLVASRDVVTWGLITQTCHPGSAANIIQIIFAKIHSLPLDHHNIPGWMIYMYYAPAPVLSTRN